MKPKHIFDSIFLNKINNTNYILTEDKQNRQTKIEGKDEGDWEWSLRSSSVQSLATTCHMHSACSQNRTHVIARKTASSFALQ